MMLVLVLSDISRSLPGWREARALVESAGHEWHDPGAMPAIKSPIERLQQADALFVGLAPISRSVIEAAPRLRAIVRPGVGVDNIDLDAATDRGVIVCNTPGSNSEVVAD